MHYNVLCLKRQSMKNEEIIDSMLEIRMRSKFVQFDFSILRILFRAIHPADKRLYANGDFEGVRHQLLLLLYRKSFPRLHCMSLVVQIHVR